MISQEILNDMDKYIGNLKRIRKENPELAKELATKSLIGSGILNPDGSIKEKIVD